MTRKWVLTAAVIAAGLFAVGCGAVSDATKKGTEASKAAGEKVEKAKEEVGKVAAIADDANAAVTDLTKALEPVQKKLGDIEKSMMAEPDAGKKAELAKLFTGGSEKLKEIADSIKNTFAADKLKDFATKEALMKAKDAIMAKIAELKKMVGL